jgi:hypothetical protein
MKVKEWLRSVRGKESPDDAYVDGAQLPAEPEGPYRARLVEATHHASPEGIDVGEREVIRGQVQLLYRVRCPCSHQWTADEFRRLSLCPKCGRAVLVELPELPTA